VALDDSIGETTNPTARRDRFLNLVSCPETGVATSSKPWLSERVNGNTATLLAIGDELELQRQRVLNVL
jgi:hypothetical protein